MLIGYKKGMIKTKKYSDDEALILLIDVKPTKKPYILIRLQSKKKKSFLIYILLMI
jgi:hypothetical protein